MRKQARRVDLLNSSRLDLVQQLAQNCSIMQGVAQALRKLRAGHTRDPCLRLCLQLGIELVSLLLRQLSVQSVTTTSCIHAVRR